MTKARLIGGAAGASKPRLVSYTSGTALNQDACTVTKPSGVVAGNLLVIVQGYPSTSHATTFSGGFTYGPFDSNGFIPAVGMNVQFKRASGSEGATFINDIAGSALDVAWWVGNFEFYHGTSDAEGSSANGSSTAPDSPNEATSWGSADAGFLSAICFESAAGISAYPGNCGAGRLEVAGASCDISLGISIGYGRNVSAFDPSAYTLSSSAKWAACTLAFRAA